jgi:hypothetical protein
VKIPERCVLAFSRKVVDGLVQAGKARMVSSVETEMGDLPVYEVEVEGRTLAVMQPGITGPFVAAVLEELIEVDMTEHQFAQLITTMNQGMGIPCTIRHILMERVPEVPEGLESEAETIHKEFKTVAGKFADRFTELRKAAEMLDKPMTAAVEGFVHAGYDLDAAAILLCESDGTPDEVAEEIERMLDVLSGSGASRMEVSKDEAQRLKFWSGRKNAFPASGRISPDYMCMDSTIPRKRLADILLAIAEMEKKYALRCCNVFHAGDGNLHPLILFDANDPDQLHRAEAFGADILETSVEMGGTITGEHGVGVEKLGSMCVQFSPAEREQMFAVKRAFDPKGLLNPGKVIPSLQRCAEYGKMHVHRGMLPFPDLPRF